MATAKNKITYRLINPDDVIIVALDMGVEHTGVSVWCPGVEEPSIFQVENHEKRMAFKPVAMAESVLDAVVDDEIVDTFWGHFPLLFCIEDYSYGGVHYNVLQPEVIGAFKYSLRNSDPVAGITFVNQATIRKVVAGSGRAKKSQVKKAVKEAGYPLKSGHMADSVAVYLTYKQIWDRYEEGSYGRSMILMPGLINREL